MKNILLVSAVLASLLITFDLFLKEPPVWPDEAGLAQYSILAGQNPMQYYMHYPSVYIVALSGWFNIFGTSIQNQRLFSLIAGVFTIIIFCLILNRISIKNNLFIIAGLILLLTDFTFLQATRVGRPEMWTLLLGLSSIYFLYLFFNSNYKKFIFLLLSFIMAFSSFAFHINGLIYVLSIVVILCFHIKNIPNVGKKILLMILIFLPFIVWIISQVQFFLSFILLRLKIGSAQGTWIYTVFSSKPLELKLIYLSFIVISLLITVYFIKNKTKDLLIIVIPLIFSWIIFLLNKDFWYAVYLVPFVILSLICLLDKSSEKRKSSDNKIYFFTIVTIGIILLLSNLKFHLDILMTEGGDKYSYGEYASEIQKNIPDGKTVFNSAIPDSYFAFVNRRNFKYFSFPQSFTEKNIYLKELNATDYIIFNGSYGDNYYGDIVLKYIEQNRLNTVLIGQPGQYQAYIIELKPRDQRKDPQ